MKKQLLLITLVAIGFISCKDNTKNTQQIIDDTIETAVPEKIEYDTNSPKTILTAVAEAAGGFDGLKKLNDVEFDYHYIQPDGKKDVSKERYIFKNEASWAKYSVHEVNVSPDLKGDLVQFYDGKGAFAYHNGKALIDPKVVGTSQFLRQANYMWFTMMYKITDPGIISTYQGQEEKEGTLYDLVNITYDPAVTGKEQNDTYILYVNPSSNVVEYFKFSLPAFGVLEPVLLAKLTYKEIEGVNIISKREMFAPNPEGGYVPMVSQKLENIKFNNGFTSEGLSKDI